MTTWTFYDFLEERGVNPIRQWLDSLPDKARAKINTRIVFLMAQIVWPEQYVSSLTGWPELVGLRVVHANVQYRPLDFYGPGRREFTIVLGSVEKGWLPNRILEAADANRKLILAIGRNRIRGHEFDKAPDAGTDAG
jgi:hypothetical protein